MINMRYLGIVAAVAVCLAVSATAQAITYTWDFSNAADYYTVNAVVTAGTPGSAYVASLAPEEDEASVLAKINTQAYHLGVGDILGGGFTVSGMNNPGAVYGSLYLSPTGGGGSTVLILLSPMSSTGSGGAYEYTFDLDTHADVRTRTPPGDWSAYNSETSGTFANAIGWINTNGYGSNYAAFWGPQIGMSGTYGTTFTVSQIDLNVVPEPVTMAGLALGIGSIAGYVRRRRRAA